MNALLLIVVLVVLIVVHEFGHFIAAKLSGMRVDEFGLGYPPRALTLGKMGDTTYTLNWLPFGGFVKIFGEDPSTANTPQKDGEPAVRVIPDPRAFGSKNRFLQGIVLLAGIVMNLAFAYVLITSALIAGTPRALSQEEVPHATGKALAIAAVLPSSPAAVAGLAPGDTITNATDAQGAWSATDPKSFSAFIAESDGTPITLAILHNDKQQTLVVTPTAGLVKTDPTRFALGVEVSTIGVVSVPFFEALKQGVQLTWGVVTLTAVGLGHFFYGIVTFSADLSQVAGPVGIAGAVGSASAQGFGDLLALVAIISVNLALINLIPIPALDGGRLLFVIIESVIRRPIKPQIAQAVNAVGFAFLILLMVVVTGHDIFNLVG